jgi:SOS-response transcriptional repressor LexA
MIDNHKESILAFYTKHKRMPGYKEIMSLTGFKSKNAVYKLINKLVELGVLSKDAQGKITLVRQMNEVPVLGLVEAGFPNQHITTLAYEQSRQKWAEKWKESPKIAHYYKITPSLQPHSYRQMLV